MPDSKTIFVTGGTGNQGGAVVRSLLSKGFKVRALARDPSSTLARELKSLSAEVVKGDLNAPDTFKDYLNGVQGLFSVQSLEGGIQKEIKQGILLADLAKEFKIDHLIYSSVVGADMSTGIPHWESKFKIENHIRQIGQPHTIIRPSSFFENFLIPQVKGRLLKGKFVSPLNKSVIQQFIAAKDIGELSTEIFTNTDNYPGRIITLASEEMDQEKVAATFSETLGKPVKYQKLPSLITRLAMGKDLYKMFSWVNTNNGVFIKDMNAFRKDYPRLLTLSEWIRAYFK